MAIVRGESNRNIAQQFGVHYSAVHRHRPHVLAEVKAEQDGRKEIRVAGLRVTKEQVITGLLQVVKNAANDASTVAAWREIAKLEALYPDKNIHHMIEKLSPEEARRLNALDDAAFAAALGIPFTSNGG